MIRVTLILLFLSTHLFAASISYDKYISLDPKKKNSLIKKYVKEKNGLKYISVAHYNVISDAENDTALKYALLMDNFYVRFTKIFTGKFKITSKPKLFLMKENSSYGKAIFDFSEGNTNAGWSAGMYFYWGKKRALFVNLQYGHDQCVKIMFHEGTHQLLHAYIGYSMPVWFNEGTATNFETWAIERSATNNIQWALFESNRCPYLMSIYPNKGHVSFQQLAAITSQQWSGSSKPSNNYSSAWGAVNALLSNDTGKKYFNSIIGGLRSGKSFSKIMSSGTAANFDKFLKKYIEETIIPHNKYTAGIMHLLKNKMDTKAAELTEKFIYEYPKNNYAEYFEVLAKANALSYSPMVVDQTEVIPSDISEDAAAVKKYKKDISNKYRDILKTMKKLKKYGPIHPEYSYGLARVYALSGSRSTAVTELKKMIAMNPRHQPSLQLLEKLTAKPKK